MPPSHVLILGAGLAGPALALSLARNGMSSTIFEIRPNRSDSGGSLSLAPNASRALDAIGVLDHIKAEGHLYENLSFYSESGLYFGTAGDGDLSTYPLIRIMRSTLNKILIDACSMQASLIEIKWGAKLVRIQEDSNGIKAFFEDGSTARGDILVGADGVHSKVREHVLSSNAPQASYIGSCTVAGFLPRDKVVLPAHAKLPIGLFTPRGIVMAFLLDPKGDTVTFGISQDIRADKGREGWAAFEQTGEAFELAKQQYSESTSVITRSLLDNVDATRTKVWAPYSIPSLPSWYLGRVLLIGDAAHSLPPNGQGSAMAFEDVAFLTRLLTDKATSIKPYSDIFAQFERKRRPRINKIAKMTGLGSKTKKATANPVIWFLFQIAIWLFFKVTTVLNRKNAVTAYDITSETLD